MRRRFMPRLALMAFIFFMLFAFMVAAFVTVLAGAFNALAGGGIHPLLPLGLLFVLMVSFSAARGIRRIVAPLGDLIGAAERVEAGDYSARVRPRGPRELRALGGAFNNMSARLERSEAERRRLVADVTHELRTPLTVMQGNLEALLDHVYDADDARIESILEETRVLSRLVDDLRTLSLAEAGALALHREPTDVVALVRETAASFRSQADQRGVAIDVKEDTAVPTVEADPVRTREVLTNLLSNALRYTPRGGSVRVGIVPWPDHVSVEVRDTGSGIAEDALPHIFDRFYKSDESRGSGLGLAIARSLVVAQGGEIRASSTPGQGTEIRFTLPLVS
jgi:signal transduction histidine kinase